MGQTHMSIAYADFIARKSQLKPGSGFEPLWLPDFLYGFQAALDAWAIRRGRAAIGERRP